MRREDKIIVSGHQNLKYITIDRLPPFINLGYTTLFIYDIYYCPYSVNTIVYNALLISVCKLYIIYTLKVHQFYNKIYLKIFIMTYIMRSSFPMQSINEYYKINARYSLKKYISFFSLHLALSPETRR